MISLKKNDKIIIIVAIVILVIAGAGVAMYQSPQPQDDFIPSNIDQDSYNVTWIVRNGSADTISEYAYKNAPYGDKMQINEGNIKSITFNMTWTDDRMTLLKRMGLDTLTLDVTTPDGMTYTQSNTSARITGAGSITLTLYAGVIPPSEPIEAEDQDDAQSKLMISPYYDDSWTDKDIFINVSVKIGEIRLLKKIRDKGNGFDLKITYQYYEGMINLDTTKDTGGETPPPDDYWPEEEIEIIEPPFISMIISTGCGRFV